MDKNTRELINKRERIKKVISRIEHRYKGRLLTCSLLYQFKMQQLNEVNKKLKSEV